MNDRESNISMDKLELFHTDLNSAMMYKGQHPDVTLLVSVEKALSDNDDFWKDDQVMAVIRNNTIVLRLAEDTNQEQVQQFILLYHIQNIPSLAVFGCNNPGIVQNWTEYPTVQQFVAYFQVSEPNNSDLQMAEMPMVENPYAPSTSIETPHYMPKTTKISLQNAGNTYEKSFLATDTVGELRKWIIEMLGSDIEVVVQHLRTPLADDNSLTLQDADLCPSAILKVLEITLQDEPQRGVGAPPRATRPNAGHNRAQPARQGRSNRCWVKTCHAFSFVFAFINPWSNPEAYEEDFWQFQPNPQYEALANYRPSNR